jgi:DNA-binding Lrp family transcriptional regulator
MSTENILKPVLLKLFKEGKSEDEAHKEVSKSYSSYRVSKKAVNTWFEKFKSEEHSVANTAIPSSIVELMDLYLIDLIDKNPNLSIEKIARLAKCSRNSICNRINKLENSGKNVNYCRKDGTKFTNEYLIDLVNKMPDFSVEKLSKFAGFSEGAFRNRINKLNSSGESVNYCKKDNFKFTDEYLIELVDKNPGLNIAELAELASTSQNTISRRIKQIKSAGKNIAYPCKNNPGCKIKTNVASRPKLTDECLINLIDENPDLSIEKLAGLANIPRSTMCKRIKRINSNSERVVYHKKDNKKFTNEYLVNLIDENPGLNMKNLSTLVNTSVFAIFNRIKQINGGDIEINYCKKDNKKFSDEHIIDLIDTNPDFNLEKLAILTGTSIDSIRNRIKNINNSGKRANYVKKLKVKITDEVLIGLINENPDMNMKQLAKLSNTSTSTISKRIKKINSNGERVKYISKRKLNN